MMDPNLMVITKDPFNSVFNMARGALASRLCVSYLRI